jgi:hypothetical protein
MGIMISRIGLTLLAEYFRDLLLGAFVLERRLVLGRFCDLRDECFDVRGLLQEIQRSQLHRCDCLAERCATGQQNDLKVRVDPQEPLQRLDAVHAGHGHVQQNGVELPLSRLHQRDFAVLRRVDVEAARLESIGQGADEFLLVVDEKNRGFAHRHRLRLMQCSPLLLRRACQEKGIPDSPRRRATVRSSILTRHGLFRALTGRAQDAKKIIDLRGLHQIVESSQRHSLLCVLFGAVARQQDDLQIRLHFLDRLDDIQAADPRHLHIQEHHVAWRRFQIGNRSCTGRHAAGLDSPEGEALHEGADQLLLVIHDQDA